jgi:hypothetical protein
VKILNMEQGSPEWFKVRRGIPTASSFDKLITAVKGEPSAQAHDYLCELVGDAFTLIPPENAESYFTNASIRWGQACEAEARRWYAMERQLDVEQVGFCLHDSESFGCSPDGLMCELRGGLELKCPQAKTQVKYLLKGGLPPEYKQQVHGALCVSGFDWWDFVSYSPGLPPLLVRVEPDGYTKQLLQAIQDFCGRLVEALKVMRNF